MVVQHNMQAMNANRQLGVTTESQKKSSTESSKLDLLGLGHSLNVNDFMRKGE